MSFQHVGAQLLGYCTRQNLLCHTNCNLQEIAQRAALLSVTRMQHLASDAVVHNSGPIALGETMTLKERFSS